MWSKQADTRNKNMTSFKNKITNRKRKTTNPTVESSDTLAANTKPENKTDNKKKHQRSGKNRGRNRNKNDSNETELTSHAVQDGKESNSCGSNDDITRLITNEDLETADVVLRNTNNIDGSQRKANNTLKRYSDSFVIENNTLIDTSKVIEKPEQIHVLTRAVSGFFVIDHARKNRRFSDLFRHGAMKLSNSTENLKMSSKDDIKTEKKISKNDLKKAAKLNKESAKDNNNIKNVDKKKSALAKSTSNVKSSNVISKKDVTPVVENNSYLKRVKSKIYKSKTDTTASSKADEVDCGKTKKLKPRKSVEVNGRIPEDEVAVLTSPELRKSLTHFDFRLIRQSSNLERIRTFGVKKDFDDITTGSISAGEKPVLAKAKSSSAINLNLLRARRNKVLDQSAPKSANCKNVQDEFDFFAFGSVSAKNSTLNHQPRLFGSQTSLNKPSWLHYKGEVKTGQPVSRSGSDRRPDAVREENLRHQESSAAADSSHEANHDKDEVTTPDSTASLPASGNKRRATSTINRSESVKEQSEKRKQRRHGSGRNISDPSHNNTSGDVELEQQPGLSNTDSGSSSNSSISFNGRLSESPSNSVDPVAQNFVRVKSDSDSDMDEVDPVNWQDLISEDELKKLNPNEKKRQDVINELFHTEGSHVRNLKVLFKIFFTRLRDSQTLKTDELCLIFPNIKEMLDIHTELSKEMRRRRKEDRIVRDVGDMLVRMFDGESLQRAAATFCERQQLALEFIKDRRKRDSKFDSILTECEKKRQCRRLPLQGIMPTEMQRLSKYPLLLERLISSVEGNNEESQEELIKLRKAHNMSKEILNYVNEAAKLALNRARLEDIQRHLDTSSFERSDHQIVNEFRTLDLTKYKLILEGGMQLRRPNKAIVPVHILLLEEAVMILHREGDRFLLKFFQSGSSAQPQPLSPIIKMNTLLVRINAVCKNALFLVNTSTNNSQMYDLMAEDDNKRDAWFKHFSDAANAYNIREGKTKRHEPATDSDDSESVQELPLTGSLSERAETVGGDDNSSSVSETAARVDNDSVNEEDNDEPDDDDEDEDREVTASPEMVAGGGIQTSRVSAEDWPLIQPSQVNVAIPPVHTAETKLTPIEQIRRKDAEVKQALADKEGLVADLLSIPREHFQHIADMASADTSASRDLSERILGAIYQVNQLQLAVNKSLNISESDALAVKGGKHPVCTSQQVLAEENANVPSVPAHIVLPYCTSLITQLTTFLSEMKQVEDERDRLRKELHNVRERLHEQHNLHNPVRINDEDLTPTECVSDKLNADSESTQQECSLKSECESSEQEQ